MVGVVMLSAFLAAGSVAAAPPPLEGIWNCGGYPRRGTFGVDQAWIAGCELLYEWRELEPTPGVYDWGRVEKDFAPWLVAGKRVGLRVMTACNSGSATPLWVYADGVPNIDTADYAPGDIVYPVFWDERFVALWRRFVRELGKRFDGRRGLAFVQVGGVGRWEETYVHTDNEAMSAAWQRAGYTHDGYLAHCADMAELYQQAFRRTPVLLSISIGGPDPQRSDRDVIGFALAQLALERGLYLKQNGWGAWYSYTDHNHFSRIFRGTRGKTRRVYEQGSGVSSPWGAQQGDIRSTLLRALADGPDALWIYEEDLTHEPFREALVWAATRLGARTPLELLPLPGQTPETVAYIRFEEQVGRYAGVSADKRHGYPFYGLSVGAPWTPLPPDMALSAVCVDGATGGAAGPEAPYVYLDMEESLVEALGGPLRHAARLTLRVRLLDTGGALVVEHNPDVCGRWAARVAAPLKAGGRWRELVVELHNVVFPPDWDGLPSWDFRLRAEPGSLTLHSVRLTLD